MRTRLCLLALACGVVAASPAGATPPAPSYSAVMTNDSSCLFSIAASWQHVKVGQVFANWYEDGTFIFTTDGTIQGNKAFLSAGPLVPTTTSHDWYALVNFYSSSGAQLQQLYTNTDTANCGIDGQT
jgi:hypothetical protein